MNTSAQNRRFRNNHNFRAESGLHWHIANNPQSKRKVSLPNARRDTCDRSCQNKRSKVLKTALAATGERRHVCQKVHTYMSPKSRDPHHSPNKTRISSDSRVNLSIKQHSATTKNQKISSTWTRWHTGTHTPTTPGEEENPTDPSSI